MTDLFGTVEDTRYYYFVNLRYVRFFWKNEKYYDKPLYCCFTFIKTEVSRKSIVHRVILRTSRATQTVHLLKIVLIHQLN